MRTVLYFVVITSLVLSLTACSLLSPGKKEFFQKKVPAYPEKVKLEEKQKQAATYVAAKVFVAYEEGLKADVTNSVMIPLAEANAVATPLADSMGHPDKLYTGKATNLVNELDKLSAKYEAALRKLEIKLEAVSGKEIEGTGLIQVGYFTYILILFGVVVFLWFVLRIVSIFNPPLALGMQVASTGVGLVRKGFTEVIAAGEKFKGMVKEQVTDPETQTKVLKLFRSAHLEEQSKDTQEVIKTLTNNPNDPKTAVKALK